MLNMNSLFLLLFSRTSSSVSACELPWCTAASSALLQQQERGDCLILGTPVPPARCNALLLPFHFFFSSLLSSFLLILVPVPLLAIQPLPPSLFSLCASPPPRTPFQVLLPPELLYPSHSGPSRCTVLISGHVTAGGRSGVAICKLLLTTHLGCLIFTGIHPGLPLMTLER